MNANNVLSIGSTPHPFVGKNNPISGQINGRVTPIGRLAKHKGESIINNMIHNVRPINNVNTTLRQSGFKNSFQLI